MDVVLAHAGRRVLELNFKFGNLGSEPRKRPCCFSTSKSRVCTVKENRLQSVATHSCLVGKVAYSDAPSAVLACSKMAMVRVLLLHLSSVLWMRSAIWTDSSAVPSASSGCRLHAGQISEDLPHFRLELHKIFAVRACWAGGVGRHRGIIELRQVVSWLSCGYAFLRMSCT